MGGTRYRAAADQELKPQVQQPTCLNTSVLRRSTRPRRPPQRLDPSPNIVHSHILYTDAGEPETLDEARRDRSHNEWEQAMKDEMASLQHNKTWELAALPEGKKALLNKWVFRKKTEADGSTRYKARLVVKGYSQKEGIDYDEIFSPVVKMTFIRVLLSIVAANDLYLE